jgi:spore photoproduct lyase
MFIPKQILLEKDILDYPLAADIVNYFKSTPHVEIIQLTNNRLKEHIGGEDLYTQYRQGKKTLVVGTKKGLTFQSCKPSAHYQLPLVSGCMGQCEYCYLNTQLGDKPFIRVHVNIDEVLKKASHYIQERAPEITIFEGAATSDPVPVEPYTHLLKKTILFFAREEMARFRFVTKYSDIDSLVDLCHNGHTEVRFSINTPTIIQTYEKGTASFEKRIEASVKLMEKGYPVGYLIAPVFIYEGWQEEYLKLLTTLKKALPPNRAHPITFEVISHRYTTVAKNRILQIFPQTTLPMEDEERRYQYGQFGYGKYVYTKEDLTQIKDFFTKHLTNFFDNMDLKYII